MSRKRKTLLCIVIIALLSIVILSVYHFTKNHYIISCETSKNDGILLFIHNICNSKTHVLIYNNGHIMVNKALYWEPNDYYKEKKLRIFSKKYKLNYDDTICRHILEKLDMNFMEFLFKYRDDLPDDNVLKIKIPEYIRKGTVQEALESNNKEAETFLLHWRSKQYGAKLKY